jgi:hypothetical protein
MRSGTATVALVLDIVLQQLQPSASPLGTFCATEERGCYRDCYDPAAKK